jgi:hypothetical protein
LIVSKATVTRLFLGGLIAAAAGAVVILAAVSYAFGSGVFVMDGTRVVDIQETGLAFGLLGLTIIGALAIIGGAITGLVSWIGALLNTWQVESKAWFVGLLLLGIFNFGFFAMIAYVLSGPDGKRSPAARLAVEPAPA